MLAVVSHACPIVTLITYVMEIAPPSETAPLLPARHRFYQHRVSRRTAQCR